MHAHVGDVAHVYRPYILMYLLNQGDVYASILFKS